MFHEVIDTCKCSFFYVQIFTHEVLDEHIYLWPYNSFDLNKHQQNFKHNCRFILKLRNYVREHHILTAQVQ